MDDEKAKEILQENVMYEIKPFLVKLMSDQEIQAKMMKIDMPKQNRYHGKEEVSNTLKFLEELMEIFEKYPLMISNTFKFEEYIPLWVDYVSEIKGKEERESFLNRILKGKFVS